MYVFFPMLHIKATIIVIVIFVGVISFVTTSLEVYSPKEQRCYTPARAGCLQAADQFDCRLRHVCSKAHMFTSSDAGAWLLTVSLT